MLVHISHASRIIAAYRAALHRKEQLLLALLSHRMSSTVALSVTGAEEHYQGLLIPLQRAEDRLHGLREILVQAHSNLMTHVSISQAQSSNAMMVQMRLLAQVAAVCLPVQILTSLFGVNFLLPYQFGSPEGSSTHAPFFILVSVIVVWVATLVPLLIVQAKRSHAIAM
jgi:Mg2+ and Co2+ transporter CorA